MKKMIVLNHKTYLDYNEIVKYIKKVKDYFRKDIDVVICPSNIFIPFFTGKYDFKLGSQNIFYDLATGETTGRQLKSLGVTHCIIGHSERKENFNEDENMINKKIKEALDNCIVPIVCVGETKEERLRKKTLEVIAKQMQYYFKKIDFNSDIVIAYEPIWAIGTGIIPKNSDIEEIINFIKEIVIKKYNIKVRVLYGGSINDENAKEILKIENLDGLLLGKISTDPEKALKIINII